MRVAVVVQRLPRGGLNGMMTIRSRSARCQLPPPLLARLLSMMGALVLHPIVTVLCLQLCILAVLSLEIGMLLGVCGHPVLTLYPTSVQTTPRSLGFGLLVQERQLRTCLRAYL